MGTGPTSLPAHRPGTSHLALFAASERARRQAVGAWIRDGLALGDRAIYCERPTEPLSRSIVSILDDQGVDTRDALAARRLVVLPPEEVFGGSGTEDLLEQAHDDGFPGVHLSGEAAVAVAMLPRELHAATERRLDALSRQQPLSVLCQYDLPSLPGGVLDLVAEVHLPGIWGTELMTAPAPGGLALSGSVDGANADLLAAVVRAATAYAQATAQSWVVRLDVRALEFLSSEGLAALLAASADFRSRGGAVELLGAGDVLRRTVETLDRERALVLR